MKKAAAKIINSIILSAVVFRASRNSVFGKFIFLKPAKDRYGNSCLHLAARHLRCQMVQFLLYRGLFLGLITGLIKSISESNRLCRWSSDYPYHVFLFFNRAWFKLPLFSLLNHLSSFVLPSTVLSYFPVSLIAKYMGIYPYGVSCNFSSHSAYLPLLFYLTYYLSLY